MVFLLIRKFQKDLDSKELRIRATEWAKMKAVPTEKALKELGILDINKSLEISIDPKIIDEATTLAETSKVKMGGEGSLNLIYACTVLSNANSAVETGVAYGWSSLAFLLALKEKNISKLISVDMPYPKLNNEKFVGVVVPENLKSTWEVIKEPDRNGLKKALKKMGGKIDICHYDSDKSYQGREFAYPLLWDSLSIGGIFISDDIQDNFAFRDFVISKKLTFAITEHQGKYIGIVKK